jgi:hypothetical protein
MSDVDTQVIALKERVSAAEKAKMLAEVKVQQAQQEVDKASTLLKEKFGVESLEEAKSLLESLREDLNSKIAHVSELMDDFERQQ